MKKKPPPVGEKDKLECPVCKRMEFVAEDDLILHIVNYHKLANSLKHDLSIIKNANSNSYTIKCVKCSRIFQDNDNFFIHLFKDHLKEVLKTIGGSKHKANLNNIKNLFESLQVKKSQSSISITDEKNNPQDIDYILSIEYWETAQISNQVDSEVQTEQSSILQPSHIKQFKQQIDSSNLAPNEEKHENSAFLSNAAKRIYNISKTDNFSFFDNKSSTVDATINFNDDDDNDSDDEYLSFIASTIDANNVRLQNGKLATQAEEKKKSKKKISVIAKRKEEERSFFDKLEQVTDMLILQKIIINNQTQHKCLKCNLDFDNEFMLMKHIWDYHSEEDFLIY